jgi:hypothetical protein
MSDRFRRIYKSARRRWVEPASAGVMRSPAVYRRRVEHGAHCWTIPPGCICMKYCSIFKIRKNKYLPGMPFFAIFLTLS